MLDPFKLNLVSFHSQRIHEGLSEEEAWRLFQQLLEALVYMSSLGILHRDIKLTNIFIGKHLVVLGIGLNLIITICKMPRATVKVNANFFYQ